MTGGFGRDRSLGGSRTRTGTNPTGKQELHDRLGAPEGVLDEAVELYEQVSGSETVAPHTDALPVAVLYITVRQQGIPRTIDEIAAVADVPPRTVYQAARVVSDELDQAIPPAEPEMYISRLAEEFDLPTAVEKDALQILAAARETGYHAGRDPAGLAAGAVYATLDEREDGPELTQRQLCQVTDSHTRTVRQSYRALKDIAAGADEE